MRPPILLVMLLSACSPQQPSAPAIATGIYKGEGRDGLCIAQEGDDYRGGLITFGKDDNNCSASGRIETQNGQMALVPRGEGECRIPLISEGNLVRIGSVPAACSYYCGPGAGMAGKSFSRSEGQSSVADFAGDPLC